jgi:hypothetical protein
MTSQHKTQTNRANSQKSSGPKTVAGKRKASGNSRKHGFAGMKWQQLAGSVEVEELAEALCEDQQDPALLVQARIIAQNDLLRRAMQQYKLSLLERLMTQSESEYRKEIDEKLLVAVFDKFKGQLPSLLALRPRYSSERILNLAAEHLEGKDLTAFRKFVKKLRDRQRPWPGQVDPCKALELAAPEIDSLERYESRAWTRQMRAMRNFIEISRSTDGRSQA